jgi:[acyl-carrier-protein] S-malonyltransferase
MGKAWYDASLEARAVFTRADAYLGDRLGSKLTELCFSGPADRLNQTDVSQPAIYVASVASWAALLAGWQAGASSAVPEAGLNCAAGLSLGEYTALHIAGVFGFEEGLELVTLRGRAMQDAATAVPSGMVALIGADEAQAQQVCDQARGNGILVRANFNAPGQIVISGDQSACDRSIPIAAALGLRAAVLPVAGAFHSPIMAPAAERLAAALKQTSIRPPKCDVFSNVTGLPHQADLATGASIEDTIRRRLVEQLTHPVLWAQGCANLIQSVSAKAGGGSGDIIEYHELAPGKTLAGLMRRINKSVKVETHDEPASAQ